MDYGDLTLNEIKKGYCFDDRKQAFICNYCKKTFQTGQVFSIDGNFYEPESAVDKHIAIEHSGNFMQLIDSDTKYNTLTDNQKELLCLFYAGMSDSEISKKLGVSASTIRHQKFTFREKAKQAKFYLAIFENVFENKATDEQSIISIHNHAKCCDERYVTTKQEESHILETFFESLNPLKLKSLSSKEKNKIVILAKIAEEFELGKHYTEKEVNQILKSIYDDISALRRYLIMYGFLDRAKDGSSYWLTN